MEIASNAVRLSTSGSHSFLLKDNLSMMETFIVVVEPAGAITPGAITDTNCRVCLDQIYQK
jgi:hypothetical protein